MADPTEEAPTIHIEAVQFTPGLEPVLIHYAIGELRGIISSTQKELGWTATDPEVVAAVEAGVKKRIGIGLAVRLPEPPAPPAPEGVKESAPPA